MKITKRQLRRIIREEISRKRSVQKSLNEVLLPKEQPNIHRADEEESQKDRWMRIAGLQESILREVDTDAYEGDHDPITVEIPALETLATEKNFDGKKVWFHQSDALEIASALEDGKPTIENFDYDETRYEEALEVWGKITAPIPDWDQSEMEVLAKNIRAAVKAADESGYGY